MSSLFKKPTPSFEVRTANADASAKQALSAFETAAETLDTAADELELVAIESRTQASHLELVANDAAIAAASRRKQAYTIRGLFGGGQ